MGPGYGAGLQSGGPDAETVIGRTELSVPGVRMASDSSRAIRVWPVSAGEGGRAIARWMSAGAWCGDVAVAVMLAAMLGTLAWAVVLVP